MAPKNLLFDLSDTLVKKIYKKSFGFPYRYQSSLGDQLRRSSLSIVLNIVEGGARKSQKERYRFLNIAYSSLKETKYLIYFSKDSNLIDAAFHTRTMEEINTLAKVLYGLLYKR